MSDIFEREHIYNAEATVLSGELRTPLDHKIKPQASVQLSERGGYEAKLERDYHLEAAISFRSAHSQVAGYPATWPCEGEVTLATAQVEELNILDVITADLVVAQFRTIHHPGGYVPTVTFLGTRFENLRIAGHPVKLDLDLGILGSKPVNDTPYSRDAGFVGRVARQYQRIAACEDLPAELDERYNQVPSSFEDGETVECSLVNQVEGSYPGRSFGHVIRIPHFGILTLARLRLEQSEFHAETRVPRKSLFSLTMIDLELNCTGEGRIRCCDSKLNGVGK